MIVIPIVQATSASIQGHRSAANDPGLQVTGEFQRN